MAKKHDKAVRYCLKDENLREIAETDNLEEVSYEIEARAVDEKGETRWADILIETDEQTIVVEVKPVLEDMGQAIRQLKIYRDLFDADKSVLATTGRPRGSVKVSNFESPNQSKRDQEEQVVGKTVEEVLENEGIELLILDLRLSPKKEAQYV